MAPRKQAGHATTTPIGIAARVAMNIRKARRDADLTQGELAAELGLKEAQTVSNWERGLFKPSDENFAGLAEVLGRDPSWFYQDHREAAA